MTVTSKKAMVQSAEVRRVQITPGDQLSMEFEAAFQEHWAHVYHFLVRLVGDRDEAEDLALETFWRFYQNPPSHGQQDNQGSLGGWLHRVAANLGLNAIRSWKRRQRYEQEAIRLGELEKSKLSPTEAFTQEEEQYWVRLVLSEMKPRQAQLLILRHSGMSYKDIAAALDLSAGSIGPLLVRAEDEFEQRFRQRYLFPTGKEEEDAPG